jgi:hypothetical protein
LATIWTRRCGRLDAEAHLKSSKKGNYDFFLVLVIKLRKGSQSPICMRGEITPRCGDLS